MPGGNEVGESSDQGLTALGGLGRGHVTCGCPGILLLFGLLVNEPRQRCAPVLPDPGLRITAWAWGYSLRPWEGGFRGQSCCLPALLLPAECTYHWRCPRAVRSERTAGTGAQHWEDPALEWPAGNVFLGGKPEGGLAAPAEIPSSTQL